MQVARDTRKLILYTSMRGVVVDKVLWESQGETGTCLVNSKRVKGLNSG